MYGSSRFHILILQEDKEERGEGKRKKGQREILLH
jgi:hypothetical protein